LTVAVTYNGSATVPTNAGNYTIVATVNDPNFQATTTGTLVIAKAAPVITWNNPADIPSGTALSATQLNASADVGGVFTYSPAAGKVLSVGQGQLLTTSFVPTDTTNYSNASASVQINVTNRPPTITSGPTASANPATVGDPVTFTVVAADPDSSVSYLWNFGDGTTAATSTATHTFSPAGTYVVTVTISDGVNTPVTGTLSLTVNAAVFFGLNVKRQRRRRIR